MPRGKTGEPKVTFMNILLVDDSKAMRMIVRRTLRQAGYGQETLSEASNGDEALQLVQSTCPDLLLCDWNMPGMSGLELLLKLKSTGFNAKFGFVTSECTEEMRAKAAEAGALFLISKPFTAEDFQQELDRIFQP